MYKRILLLLFFLLLSIGCSHEGNVNSYRRSNELGFYLLADPSISAVEARQEALSDLQLAEEPLFDLDDIEYYDWGSHRFSISERAFIALRNVVKAHHSVSGIPFVVVVNQQPRYLGAFWFAYSSIGPSFPSIDATHLLTDDKGNRMLIIDRAWDAAYVNARMDNEIYETLKRAHKHVGD